MYWLVILLLVLAIVMLYAREAYVEHMCGGYDQGCHCAGNET